jgi:hypothetical protein
MQKALLFCGKGMEHNHAKIFPCLSFPAEALQAKRANGEGEGNPGLICIYKNYI